MRAGLFVLWKEVNRVSPKCNATHLIRKLLASRLERLVDEGAGGQSELDWTGILESIMIAFWFISVVCVDLIAKLTRKTKKW